MKKILFGLIVFSVTSLLATANSQADVTFSIGDVSATAGSSVSLGIFASGDELLTGFNLPFDVGSDGLGLPAGISLTGFSSPIFPGIGSSLGAPAGTADGVANSADFTLVGVSLTAAPIQVFALDFDIAASVADNTTFDISFLNQAPIDVAGANGAAVTTFSVSNSGSITVSAVPEPAAATLFGLAALAGLAMRRRS